MAGQTYTVKSGDTLSGIGSKLGVNYNQITGYRSGNPNLIYPGEVLTIPGGSPSGGAAPAPGYFQPSAPSAPSGGGGGQIGLTHDQIIKMQLDENNLPPQYYRSDAPGGSGGGLPAGPPPIDLNAIYQTALNSPEIKAAQAAINATQKQIDDRKAALATAKAGINDNPFYAEATRVGKISKLEDAANNDISNFEQQLSTNQGSLTKLQASAENTVNIAGKQYDINNQQYQQKLTQFNNLISAGALTYAKPGDVQTLSQQTGIAPSLIQSIIQKQQQGEIKPQVITATDAAGNVTFAVVDTNTGQVINKQSLGTIGQPQKVAAGSAGTASNKNLAGQFTDFVSSVKPITNGSTKVLQFPQIVAQFAPYMSLQDIYKNYSNTSLGKKYGAPKESAALINSIYKTARSGATPDSGY